MSPKLTVHMRIHRPSCLNRFTVLKDCEPPLICETANVRPCVGLTLPTLRGIQSTAKERGSVDDNGH